MAAKELFPQFGEMDEHTRKRLKESMEREGFKPSYGVPVVDENGDIIDGRHRLAVAAELGLEIPVQVAEGWTEDEKWEYAFRQNELRKHHGPDARRVAQREWLQRHPDWSNRKIAEKTGVSHNTVQKEREQMVASGQIDHIVHPKTRKDYRGIDEEEDRTPVNASNHRGETSFRFAYFYQGPNQAVRARGGLMYPRESLQLTWSINAVNSLEKVALTQKAPTTEAEWGAICDEIRDRIFRAGLAHPPATMDKEAMAWR